MFNYPFSLWLKAKMLIRLKNDFCCMNIQELKVNEVKKINFV